MQYKNWPHEDRGFEMRVPKGCVPFLLRQHYAQVPEQEKRAWLKSHFYLPAGWPRCERYARIKKLTRMRQHCWGAVRSYTTRDIGERCTGPGRPVSRQLREASLYRLIHTTHQVPEEWHWPLINLATYEKLLPLEERFWIVARPSIFPAEALRGLALFIATFAIDVSEIPNSLQKKAIQLLEQRFSLGSKTADTWYELRHLLRECRDTYAVEMLTSVAEADPSDAFCGVLSGAGRLLLANSVTHEVILERFHQLLVDYVSLEML